MKRKIMGGGGFLMIVVMVALLVPLNGWAIFGCQERCLPDDPGKFRGIWWGQYLGALKDMKLVNADRANAGEFYYVRRDDPLTFGDAKLEYVQYGFWRNLYSSVAFGTNGLQNWEALRRICFENFQRWQQPDKYVEKYYWTGRHSAMTLQYNEATGLGQLYVYSKVIYERQLALARSTGSAPISRGFWQQ